jgi:hypothetical protein
VGVEADSVIVLRTTGDRYGRGEALAHRIALSSITGLARQVLRSNTWGGAGYGTMAGLIDGGFLARKSNVRQRGAPAERAERVDNHSLQKTGGRRWCASAFIDALQLSILHDR